MTTDLIALIAELSKPEYSDLTNLEAAQAINAKTVSVRKQVSTRDLKEWLIEQGLWAKLRIAANTESTLGTLRGVCLSIVDWVDDSAGKVQSVDLDRQSVGQMIDALTTAGMVTQSQAAAFMSLGNATVSWTSYNGLPEVGIGLVINARKQMGDK
jgi:hypothetical protein